MSWTRHLLFPCLLFFVHTICFCCVWGYASYVGDHGEDWPWAPFMEINWPISRLTPFEPDGRISALIVVFSFGGLAWFFIGVLIEVLAVSFLLDVFVFTWKQAGTFTTQKLAIYVICLALVVGIPWIAFRGGSDTNEFERSLKDGRIRAVFAVANSPEKHPAITLFTASAIALGKDRIEEAAYLFWAAKIRLNFDRKCFPPAEKGSSDPFVAFSAMHFELNAALTPIVANRPKAFAKAVEKLKAFRPDASPEYDPGYKYLNRMTEQEALAASEASRQQFLSELELSAELLNDAEYFAALQIVRAANNPGERHPPTEAERERARNTMKRIQKAKNLDD